MNLFEKIILLVIFIVINSFSTFSQSDTTKKCVIKVPELFKRNGEEKFKITSNCTFFSNSFILTNRWGAVVFQATSNFDSIELSLNEKNKESDNYKMSEGVYFWKMEYSLINDKTIYEAHGFIHVF